MSERTPSKYRWRRRQKACQSFSSLRDLKKLSSSLSSFRLIGLWFGCEWLSWLIRDLFLPVRAC